MPRDSLNALDCRLDDAWTTKPGRLLSRALAWPVAACVALLATLSGGLLLALAGVAIGLRYDGITVTAGAGILSLAGLSGAALLSGCLWIRSEPPAGIALPGEDHPDLQQLVEECREAAGASRLHGMVLSPEMKASVVQNPRLGIFGWYRTYLVIGLPLMEVLDLEEFRAMLLHEFARVAGPEGRTAAWLHSTRNTWERAAAAILSPAVLAAGLRRLAIQKERLAEEFWPPLQRAVPAGGGLPEDVMERMSTLLQSEPDAGKAAQWLARALQRAADPGPGLAERLRSLGCADTPAPEPLAPRPNAVEELLRPAFLANARATFSREWLNAALNARAAGATPPPLQPGDDRTVKEAWERIASLCRLDGLDKVQPEVLALLDRRPNHSGALFLRGSHLAEKGDPSSTRFLEQAAADPVLSVRAFETLARFHARFGREEETAGLRERAARHEREFRAALVERNQVSRHDCFLPHDLCPREVASLKDTLGGEATVRRAWAGARQVKHFPGWRHLVLILEVRGPAFRPVTERMQRELVARILERWEVEGYVHILRLEETTRPILRALRRGFAESRVYRRK